jgi:hypothetical protein
MKSRLLILITFICFVASGANAAMNMALAEWDIESASNVANLKSSESTLVTASPITTNGVTALNVASYGGSFCATGWSTVSDVPDLSKYYQFSLTASGSQDLSLTGITMALEYAEYGGGTGAQYWELYAYSDADGISSAFLVSTYDLTDYAINHQVRIDGNDDGIVNGVDDLDGSDPLIDGTFEHSITIVAGETYSFLLIGYYTDSSSDDYSGLVNMEALDYGGGDVITGVGSNVILYGELATTAIPEAESAALIYGCVFFILRLACGRQGREKSAK